MKLTEAQIRVAWEILNQAIHETDEAKNNWKNLPLSRRVEMAEGRQITAIRHLQNIGAYLKCLK